MIIITQSNDDDNFFSGSFYTDNVVAPSPTGSIPDFSNITGNHITKYCYIYCIIDKRITGKQGGKSCTGARVAPAEKFGLDENFKPEHTLFCCELRLSLFTHFFLEVIFSEVGFFCGF